MSKSVLPAHGSLAEDGVASSKGGISAEVGLPVHGGDRAAAALRFGIDASTLIDLSANINPLGPPAALVAALREAAADLAALQEYPEPTYRELRERIARELHVEPDSIVVGNGAAALLEAALALERPRRCVLPVPAFSEYARALAALGIATDRVLLRADEEFALDPARFLTAAGERAADVALLTNPHNPSGTLTARTQLLELVDQLSAQGSRTVVDEAFIDYAPGESLAADAAKSDDLICVRSLTKFFAVPALRVGYAVCSPSRAVALRARLPSWPVTTIAARAVAAALDDPDFALRSRAHNVVERAWLTDRLRDIGCLVPKSAANFVLAGLPSSAQSQVVTERLAREYGVLVRDCASYAELEGAWIRIAVRTRRESKRVTQGLGLILPGQPTTMTPAPVEPRRPAKAG
jgi:threonine-phosphate decarboxylase